MLKKIMIGGLAAGAMALNAPIASAAAPAAVGCNFRAASNAVATGGQDTFSGVAWGYIASATAGNAVTIRCYLTVDGVEVTSTPTGSGTTTANTAGQITYTKSDTQSLQLHAEWTDGSDSGTIDYETQTIQVPPQEVFDAIDAVFLAAEPVFEAVDQLLFDITSIPDGTICPILASLTPGVGPVVIDSEGDVSVLVPAPLDEVFGPEIGIWDCPPYGE